MPCLCWDVCADVLSLRETPHIVCERQCAGRGSRADRKLKEEAGGCQGRRGDLGGVRGHTEDSGAEEVARQGQPLRLRARQGRDDGASACQPLLVLLGVVQGGGDTLRGSAKAWRDEVREQRERVRKVEKELKRLKERMTELEKGKGKEKEDE